MIEKPHDMDLRTFIERIDGFFSEARDLPPSVLHDKDDNTSTLLFAGANVWQAMPLANANNDVVGFVLSNPNYHPLEIEMVEIGLALVLGGRRTIAHPGLVWHRGDLSYLVQPTHKL